MNPDLLSVRRRATMILLALTLAAGIVGCSDPGSADWVTVSSGRLTVDRPASWDTTMTVRRPWTAGFRAPADQVEQFQVSGDFGEFSTATEAIGTLVGKAQVSLAGFTVVEARDVTIHGATTGRLVRYTINGDHNQPITGEWIVGAHYPYPQSVAVSIMSPTYDRDLEQRVITTMRLKPQQ
ncbi:MAG: hypothetical protein J2P23_02760 [Microlunatus sp.]|nr:hypothetical protein [Microlunatus sp.]